MKLIRLPFLLALLALLTPGASAQQYSWSTFAGQPGGRGNVDGTGAAARFAFPYGMVTDAAGNTYVADSSNHVIRRVTAAGVVTTFAGAPSLAGSRDGDAGAARFDGPQALALDSTGNLYVADANSSTVRKITPAGTVSTLAGAAGVTGTADGLGSAARFNSPRGIAVDAVGNVFVADSLNFTIRRITPAGAVTTLAGSPGFSGLSNGFGPSARFRRPRGLAVNAAGEIFVADETANAIRKITAAGEVTFFAGTPGGLGGLVDGNNLSARFRLPRAVAVDAAGNVYVADAGNNAIRKITPAAEVTTLAGNGSRGTVDGTGSAAGFYLPSGIAMTSGGDLVVADTNNLLVRRVTAAGVVTTVAGSRENIGSTDGNGTAALFNFPIGVATDSAGRVYVGDSGNNTVRRITPTGDVSALTAIGANSPLNGPAGVAVDQSGNFLVANYFGLSISRITPAGVVSTLSDSPNGGVSPFGGPYGLAVNSTSGDVYVADSILHIVCRILPDGRTLQLAGYPNGPGSSTYFDPNTGLTTQLLDSPSGVAVDASGNAFIADTNNQVIRKVTPSNVSSVFAGQVGVRGSADGTGTAAQFNGPYGLSFDTAGNLFVADFYNSTIRRITPAGVVTTVGGTAGQATTAAGVGAAARFAFPLAVAVAPDGTLYVTDTNNRVVRGVPQAAAVSQLINVSTRLRTGTGDDVLIAGFVVQGTGEKKIVVRALGPSLSAVGVSGTLSDPVLSVFNSAGTAVVTNDNWNDLSASDRTALAGFNLAPTDARESAAILSLPAGGYTTIVRGVANATGNCLVEVYDADLPAAAKLINISTRGPVGTGDSVMIAGFVVNGNAPKRVLVRALGPSLSAAGVPNLLGDPTLELFSASSSLATNDNWQDTQQAEISATGVAPTNGRESAIVATLPPGTYTAIVRGAAGSTGNALVEVYELP